MTFLVGAHEARGSGLADLDPALLAFVKCHVTTPLKWDVLRALAERADQWVSAAGLARALRRDAVTVAAVLDEAYAEDLVDAQTGDDERRYCLPSTEPSTVVLQRLIETCMQSQTLRGIIAEHLLRLHHPTARVA